MDKLVEVEITAIINGERYTGISQGHSLYIYKEDELNGYRDWIHTAFFDPANSLWAAFDTMKKTVQERSQK